VELVQFLGTLGTTAANAGIVLLFLNYLTHRDKQLTAVLKDVRSELALLNGKLDK